MSEQQRDQSQQRDQTSGQTPQQPSLSSLRRPSSSSSDSNSGGRRLKICTGDVLRAGQRRPGDRNFKLKT